LQLVIDLGQLAGKISDTFVVRKNKAVKISNKFNKFPAPVDRLDYKISSVLYTDPEL
jgi:hypothetical protein